MKTNKTLKLALCSFALAFVLNSCSQKTDEAEVPIIEETSMTQVTIKTSMGDIHLELDGEKAPITVENFKAIAFKLTEICWYRVCKVAKIAF